jgi:hypothetical protein
MIRIPYIKVLALTQDFLFATTDVAIWSTIEPGLGIVAAGAVTLRPLFRTFYAISTRNKSSAPLTASKHSRLQKSLPLRNNKLGQAELGHGQPAYKQSLRSEGGSDEMRLRSDLGSPGSGMGKGGVVVSSDPLRDENEADREGREGTWGGGIQVRRTVEVRRGERDADADSVGSVGSMSMPSTPWLGPDKDMM